MEHLNLDGKGLAAYEVPGIEGYLTLRVPAADGVFQIDVRRMPEAAGHTDLGEPARAATADEAALIFSRMFLACTAGPGCRKGMHSCGKGLRS